MPEISSCLWSRRPPSGELDAKVTSASVGWEDISIDCAGRIAIDDSQGDSYALDAAGEDDRGKVVPTDKDRYD